MPDTKDNILVWLPSPMGDAILCTPALRAIRQNFQSAKITFFGNNTIRQVLSPCSFNDAWLQWHSKNPLAIAKTLKAHKFTHAILFKNSFASGLAVFLAGIPLRIGYAREGRGISLTDKLYPPKLSGGKFKPISMIDYYLAIASWLGCDTTNRSLELLIDPQDKKKLKVKLPELARCEGPIVVIVPGGAFGPSKCWLSERFAQTADWSIANYNATVIISVSSESFERQIAQEICDASSHKLISLADRAVSVGELKALFDAADLVISNDTGPRHIAIAMGRNVITLFGPNDPAWTDTDWENEIQIAGDAPCSPCGKPVCTESEHLCMKAITVEMVCEAAKKLLEDGQKKTAFKTAQEFKEISKSFFVDMNFESALSELGLTSIDAVFSFDSGRNLAKKNLSKYRSRLQFEIGQLATTVFLKRYDRPPISIQLKNWLTHCKRISCSFIDFQSANKLAAAGINTPKTVCYGQQWAMLFEKRSFIITEKIPNAESLERKLPDYFDALATVENLKLRRNFIARLAAFIKKFHETNLRHRDLYLSHIFFDNNGQFYLIDLARTFKPKLLAERYRMKDIAQIHYSAPGKYFTKTDRLRFYLCYIGQSKLTSKDKAFIRKVNNKAKRMAKHNMKHNKEIPFLS